MVAPAAPPTAALITSDLTFDEQVLLEDAAGRAACAAHTLRACIATALQGFAVAVVVLDVGDALAPHLVLSSAVVDDAVDCSRQAMTP